MELLILLVVFAAGGVAGAMVATRVTFSRMEYYRDHADALPKDIVQLLQQRLDLSEQQVEQVRRIIEYRHPRMVEKREYGARAMLDEFDAVEQDIAAILDHRQAGLWYALAASVRHRFLPPRPGPDR